MIVFFFGERIRCAEGYDGQRCENKDIHEFKNSQMWVIVLEHPVDTTSVDSTTIVVLLIERREKEKCQLRSHFLITFHLSASQKI